MKEFRRNMVEDLLKRPRWQRNAIICSIDIIFVLLSGLVSWEFQLTYHETIVSIGIFIILSFLIIRAANGK
jgi:hypothetical protein